MMGNIAYFSHLKLFKSNILAKRTKMKLYKTRIRPILTYERMIIRRSVVGCVLIENGKGGL